MKFTCNVKEIAGAVGAASKVVNAHTTVPILGNVLLSSEDGQVIVRATDLEMTLEQRFSAQVGEAGSLTVPAKLFSGYLGNLPAGTIEVSGTATRATARFDRSNYDFHALPPDEYPPLPIAQRGTSFTVDAKSFREAASSTIFAASNEEARGAVLMGTLLELADETLTMVATDGYRLAKWSGTLVRSVSEGAPKYIVPSRALGEVARNLGNAETVEVTALGSTGNQLAFVAGVTTIVVRLVDGQYPNYGQVIPAQFDRTVVVNTAALVARLTARRGTGLGRSCVDGQAGGREPATDLGRRAAIRPETPTRSSRSSNVEKISRSRSTRATSSISCSMSIRRSWRWSSWDPSHRSRSARPKRRRWERSSTC